MRTIRNLALGIVLTLSAVGARGTEPTGFILMPPSTDGTYRVAVGPQDDRHWGRPETIRLLILVAREWHRRHGSALVLSIGDISRRDGGPFPPHITHRDGCSIDVTTTPKNVCHIDHPDQDVTLELARLFFQYGAREILYNGTYVQRLAPGVSEQVKHDDHFHVIVDPARVPREGEPFLVPEPDSTHGTVLGPGLAPAEKGGAGRRFTLGWRLLGAPERTQRSYRLVFDRDEDEANGVLFDSGSVPSGTGAQTLLLPLEDAGRYSWRVTVTGATGEWTLPWQSLETDFSPPVIRLLEPPDGAEVAANPLLRWETDPTGPRARFRIEITTDSTRRRIPYDTGDHPFEIAEHRVRGPLGKGRLHAWRVTVQDGHGNTAASEWRTFKPAGAYAWRGDPAVVVPAELRLHEGPSEHRSVLATLKAGTPVTVLGRKDDWLRVSVDWAGKKWNGYLSARHVRE